VISIPHSSSDPTQADKVLRRTHELLRQRELWVSHAYVPTEDADNQKFLIIRINLPS
jgi:hypothetical protein